MNNRWRISPPICGRTSDTYDDVPICGSPTGWTDRSGNVDGNTTRPGTGYTSVASPAKSLPMIGWVAQLIEQRIYEDRIEFRIPDPSSNPYLCFAAQLMAGIDGIKNRIEPPEPVDKDLYELPPEEHEAIEQVPTSLPEVLKALEADHEFLLEGDVFTQDLIDTWIQWKYENEVLPLQVRPHPHEFEMYFDI